MASFGEIRMIGNVDQTEDRDIRRLAETGQARQIVRGVYTTNLSEPIEKVVLRNLWQIVARLYPGAVVSGRTVGTMRPWTPEGAQGGPSYIFLTGPYSRNAITLPGVEIRINEGPSALPGDSKFITDDFYVASTERLLLENLVASRLRGGVQRTLRKDEIERLLVLHLDASGVDNFNAIRDRARALQEPLGAAKEFAALDKMMGALLGTRKARLTTQTAKFRVAGIDEACADRLNVLFSHLGTVAFQNRPQAPQQAERQSTAFIEAYFSNFIEGTRFPPDEARQIVYEGKIPKARAADSHDVISTYQLLVDEKSLVRLPDDFADFERTLRARHGLLMRERPDVKPGVFKTEVNTAGNTMFVAPDKILGTLRHGFELLQGLREPFARGIFLHCLLAEVHPFNDGNGRISRIHMSAELARGGQAHVVVPTVFRDDYIGGLRAFTGRNDPSAIVRALDRAQSLTSQIIVPSPEAAIVEWAKTCAFVEPGVNARLEEYDPAVEIEWRNGMPAPKSYWESEDNPQSLLAPSSLTR